jgi:hypothetical protein
MIARRSGVGGVANSGEWISKYNRLVHCKPARKRLLDKRCVGTGWGKFFVCSETGDIGELFFTRVPQFKTPGDGEICPFSSKYDDKRRDSSRCNISKSWHTTRFFPHANNPIPSEDLPVSQVRLHQLALRLRKSDQPRDIDRLDPRRFLMNVVLSLHVAYTQNVLKTIDKSGSNNEQALP